MKESNGFTKTFNLISHKKHLVLIIIFTMFSASALAFSEGNIQKDNPQDTKKLLKQAKKLSNDREFNEAEKVLKQILAVNPQNVDAKLTLAYVYLKSKRLLDSYNYAYDVAKADNKNSYAFAILGANYLSAGNFKEAKTLLTNAVILNKKEALGWAGLGMLDFYENRVDQSVLNLREAVFNNPKEPDFVFALAQVSARAEKYKDAANAYDVYLRISSKNDVERRDRIKGLIKFLRYLGNKTFLYKIGGESSTAVNMDVLNNRPVIKIRLEKDAEPLNFVLDTGSGISVISDKTSKRLGIKPITRGGLARALGGDGKFDIVYGFLNKVYIGDVNVRNVPIYIREFHNKNEEIDGYIGLSLISKFITTVDYGNGTFTLVKKDASAEAETEKEKTEISSVDGSMTVPLRLTSSGFLSGQVKLEGIESTLNFIVDTGASVSVISTQLADSDEMSRYGLDETMRVVGAAGVTENVPSFLLPNLTFGSFSRNRLKAIALDLNLINETSGFEQAGILGGNFLKNYSLTFDFKRSKVTFVPNVIK